MCCRAVDGWAMLLNDERGTILPRRLCENVHEQINITVTQSEKNSKNFLKESSFYLSSLANGLICSTCLYHQL